MKVAILIPTMNRPEFILRQFEFYELMDSPHPIYVSDSSNPENAEKLKNGMKKFQKFSITYQWAPPGKDCLHQLLPLVKEKYCLRMGDDDIIIPKTISECADFLEEHPDYGICAGRQVNIRLRKEDYNKPYGIVEQQTVLGGRSYEDADILTRAQDFQSSQDVPFICFAVRRVDLEKDICNVTKHFSLMEDMMEFVMNSMLAVSGKFKMLDKLGYIMQASDLRTFDHRLTEELLLLPSISEKWRACEEGFSEFLRKKGIPHLESRLIVRWLFLTSIASQYYPVISRVNIGQEGSIKKSVIVGRGQSQLKKLRHFILSNSFVKGVYYKFYPPNYVDRPESKYFNDFKVVKDFLEKNAEISIR